MKARILASALLVALVPIPLLAGAVEVRVSDRHGEPLQGIVVVAEAVDSPARAGSAGGPVDDAQMTQRNLSFEPEVLVVRAGTDVSFPNEDAVKHHVYSFSPAKRFELALYNGTEHPPERFDTPGIVTLGCNIHDSMIGYVYVTDSPHFGKTGEDGAIRLDGLGDGSYRVTIWHPRIKDDEASLTSEVTIAGAGPLVVPFALARKLKPARSNNPTSRWSDY